MSLRTRLLLGMLLLVTGALVVAAVAIYTEQRSFLLGRLDQRVIAAAAPISYQLGVDARFTPPRRERGRAASARTNNKRLGRGLGGFLPSGTYGALVSAGGRLVRGPVTTNYGDDRLPLPVFRSGFPIVPASSPKLFTVNSQRGASLRYRVAALGLESGAGTLIVAVPLREVDQTLDRLLVVELLVVTIVIVLLIGLAWFVIRLGLRPLDQMGTVASAIADGDLSRRVTPATPRTEVGRLGLSLNRMLVRIEEAFSKRATSEERLRQFLSDASHELRTPLASIRGYAELFRLGPAQDPEALERAMARIESEAKRMGALVDDLLVLARFDELPDTRWVPVECSGLGAAAAADAQAMAPNREVTLDAPDRVEVLGDPDGLRQVLANLITNAVIHTPDGTPIEISIRREDDRAVIKVRDHGDGIPDGSENHVFERFWRAENGRSRGRGGSGLGLSIVREIVRSHHGTVRAQNSADGGALFTVTLPAAPQASGEPREHALSGFSVSSKN